MAVNMQGVEAHAPTEQSSYAWQGGASLVPAGDAAGSSSKSDRTSELVTKLASQLAVLGKKRCQKNALADQLAHDEADLEQFAESWNLKINSCDLKCMLIEAAAAKSEAQRAAQQNPKHMNLVQGVRRQCKELRLRAAQDDLMASMRRSSDHNETEVHRLRQQKQRYTEQLQSLQADAQDPKHFQWLATRELCRLLSNAPAAHPRVQKAPCKARKSING